MWRANAFSNNIRCFNNGAIVLNCHINLECFPVEGSSHPCAPCTCGYPKERSVTEACCLRQSRAHAAGFALPRDEEPAPAQPRQQLPTQACCHLLWLAVWWDLMIWQFFVGRSQHKSTLFRVTTEKWEQLIFWLSLSFWSSVIIFPAYSSETGSTSETIYNNPLLNNFFTSKLNLSAWKDLVQTCENVVIRVWKAVFWSRVVSEVRGLFSRD